jgi:UvrD/REP helicase N-terminal domain
MRFLIADTFTSSLGKLTNEEQTFVKNTAFDLQINPAHPGLQFHRIERAKDKRFWSVRSGRDLRIIVHKTESDFLLCYVDHHDAAYTWAERRKLQTHPTTGAAQLVEIQETIRIVPKYVEKFEQKVVSKPFERLTDSQLLGYGVPSDWLEEIRVATEDTVLDLFTYIPAEAAEALLELATGGRAEFTDKEQVAMLPGYPDANLACVAESVTAYNADPFDHPDAKRRFALITSSDELSRALEFPWDKWTVFLHPEQRGFVEKHFNGPARVSGSAGTGKTIVALHRAFNLAIRNPDGRVLLATFSDSLARALQVNLNKLITSQPRLGEQIEVLAIPTLVKRLFEAYFGKASFASDADIRQIIASEKAQADTKKFSLHFLLKEWEQIVDAWQIRTWDEYRVVPRLGRKTRLNEDGRRILWNLFVNVRKELSIKGLITESEACQRLEERFRKDGCS